ncbi:MAG: TonB-dependent receptor [Acidobacteria bacterium]|nr:TonB-dependent receptor [Acidobacteriota bacterium]
MSLSAMRGIRWVPLFLLTLASVASDDTTGHLVGSIADNNQEPLPGAVISVEHVSTGLVRSAVSDEDGSYRFPSLPVGDYTVMVSMPGFQTTKQTVNVGIGDKTNVSFSLQPGTVSETLTVTNSAVLVDTSSTTSGLNVNLDDLVSRIPLSRDQTSVALLAPGSLEGDDGFNEDGEQGLKLASIGGTSVAENAYLVNGLNTTNFRNGLGGSQVPFEFLQEMQVKTGGYQAEFGRSTGGVINSVTKSGSNQFHYGLNLYWEPESLSSQEKDTFERTNSAEDREVMDANFYASGPVVKDKLFFYVLYNPRDREVSDTRVTRDSVFSSDDSFWGAKLDWYITENQHLEFTAFTDEQESQEVVYSFDRGLGRGDASGDGIHYRGGENFILKYTGIISPDLIISAQAGTNDFDRTNQSSADIYPYVIDSRDGSFSPVGLYVNDQPAVSVDEREAARFDVDYYLGDHNFRAGIDFEQNTSHEQIAYSGGAYYRYFIADGSETFENGNPNAGDLLVRERHFNGGGDFEVETTAIYLQDSWSINDRFTINLGLRNESFNNKNALGESFIKIDNQLAPRLGFIWDPKGDGTSKVYGNFGRYYLPIASNTNIRMSGAEFFTEEWYVAQGIDNENGGDWSPIGGGDRLEFTVFGDGEVPDAREILDTSIKPMFQDEYVLGYQTQVTANWSVGARGVHRNLGRAIEDVAVDAALNRYVQANYPNSGFEAHGFDFYVLTNPGSDLNFFVDVDEDGVLDEVTLTADELGYPEAERNYYALELTFERRWVDNWMVQGSYTWSHSYGNYEGWVRSDNEQDDAGITTLFDQPGLLDNGYGNLPNDRRHNLKIFGAYQLANKLQLGTSLRFRSGRPINAFGVHPTDEFAADYGVESFFADGVPSPRGSRGTTEDVTIIDLSAQYPLRLGRADLILRVDAFNVFDFDSVTEVEEGFDLESGGSNPNYGLPTNYQDPRRVRVSASYRF